MTLVIFVGATAIRESNIDSGDNGNDIKEEGPEYPVYFLWGDRISLLFIATKANFN